MHARLVPVGAAALLLLTACGGGGSSTQSSTAPTSAAPSAVSSSSAAVTAVSAAACNEINRLTREAIDGLTDATPAHWEAFAMQTQNVANGSPDPQMRDALTVLATGALTASEKLTAGSNVRDAVADFDAAVPAVDHLCKLAGQPLN